MKKLLKPFVVLSMFIAISGGALSVQAYARAPLSESNLSIITPLSDIIEWRYKVDNGHLYKRQYNCTKDAWIGSWVLVS